MIWMRSRKAQVLIVCLLCSVLAAYAAFQIAISMTELPSLARSENTSRQVKAADGRLLWTFLTPDGQLRIATRAQDVDERYRRMVIAYEDKRFYAHGGVDPVAVLRAAFQAVWHRRIVSGASTITMQVIRLLEPPSRTLGGKLAQMLKAIKLERSLSKQAILDLYFTLCPFGGNVESVRAASLTYFGKEPINLTWSEAALLTALPQSPETRRPDRHSRNAKRARDRVLQQLADRGILGLADAKRAQRQATPTKRMALSVLAPHFATRTASTSTDRKTVGSLIEFDLQRNIERVAHDAIRRWSEKVNLAVLVIRNRDGAVVGYVGGVDHLAKERAGQVDLVRAIRSPGSALKPFIYALAFERLIVHPDTIVADRPIDIAGYAPKNADSEYAGDITIRQALVRSVNTTAVTLLSEVGIEQFLSRFRSTGDPLKLSVNQGEAGLAVALGGVGVSLQQLTWFYTALANRGVLYPLRLIATDPVRKPLRFLSHAAATATADILADVAPPANFMRQLTRDGGRRIAFKTGTSYGFRDAWAVGFDRRHTVGVWIGRPDGAPHLGSYGATAAAPIMLKVFDKLPRPQRDVAEGQRDLINLGSPKRLPRRLQRFTYSGKMAGQEPLAIRYPKDGAILKQDKLSSVIKTIPLVAAGGTPPYFWSVDGGPLAPQIQQELKWAPPGRGHFDIRLIDARGTEASVVVWID